MVHCGVSPTNPKHLCSDSLSFAKPKPVSDYSVIMKSRTQREHASTNATPSPCCLVPFQFVLKEYLYTRSFIVLHSATSSCARGLTAAQQNAGGVKRVFSEVEGREKDECRES